MNLLDSFPPECPAWPPDVFGWLALLLTQGELFLDVVEEPYGNALLPADFPGLVASLADAWRRSCTVEGAIQVPPSIEQDWLLVRTVLRSASPTASSPEVAFRDNKAALAAAFRLLAVADEAGRGLGLGVYPEDRADSSEDQPSWERRLSNFAEGYLLRSSQASMTSQAFPSGLGSVLPKRHCPQRGISFRSLSHYLSWHAGGAKIARWSTPLVVSSAVRARLDLLNILVLPWPLELERSQFHEVRLPRSGGGHPARTKLHRFFRYTPRTLQSWPCFQHEMERAIQEAKRIASDVDLVVFPELALSEELEEIAKKVAIQEGTALVCGVGGIPGENGLSANRVLMDFSGWLREQEGEAGPSLLQVTQDKHHRWCLDEPQLVQYSLLGRLLPHYLYWESCTLSPRKVTFVTVQGWLTVCPLICEDLAQQDPVAQVVRSVAPNLVVGLLMDGPQVGNRWGAKYASVFAEDPGCSVLTVTSLGMSALSQDYAREAGWQDRHRAVALWRDKVRGERSLSLDKGAVGLLLHVVNQVHPEYSADGREHPNANVPVLVGTSQVRVG